MKRFHLIGVVFLIALFAAAVTLGIAGCRRAAETPAEPEAITPIAAPAEECASFVGTWDVNLGELTVVQEGCEAEGKLKGTGGGYYALEGHVTGDTWDFSWKGPEGRGHGYLTMDPAGGKFIGEHGDGDSTTGKGRWDGIIR
jgi:hypothetical protein